MVAVAGNAHQWFDRFRDSLRAPLLHSVCQKFGNAEFCATKKPMGFGVEAWDGSDAHHARCQICEHAQLQDQPLYATGRHPGDVLPKFQPLPTTRASARAKKL